MQEILGLAWDRMQLITSIVGEVQGRVVMWILYFTIVLPFGIGSRLLSDPLRRKQAPHWVNREPVPTDLESARQQG